MGTAAATSTGGAHNDSATNGEDANQPSSESASTPDAPGDGLHDDPATNGEDANQPFSESAATSDAPGDGLHISGEDSADLTQLEPETIAESGRAQNNSAPEVQ